MPTICPSAVVSPIGPFTGGVGVAGVFTYDVAETKVETVIELARQNEFPLMCSMEPAE